MLDHGRIAATGNVDEVIAIYNATPTQLIPPQADATNSRVGAS
jgi:hypothetical protein